MVEFNVHEAQPVPVAERLARAGVEIVRLDPVVLPVQEMSAVRRDAKDVSTRQLPLEHQRSFAGGRVDAVEVCGRPLMVVDVAPRVASDGPLAIRRDLEVAHRGIRERDVALCRHIEGLTEREAAVLIGAHHLRRLDALVDGIPHVDVRRLVRRLACRVRRRGLLLDAEEHTRVVFAPRDSAAIADDPSLREVVGLRRIEDHRLHDLVSLVIERARDVGEGDQHIVLLAHLLDVASLDGGECRASVVPHETVVLLGLVVERRRPSAARVEDE